MNKIVFFVTVLGAALLISNPTLAKGKGQGKQKHQSQSSIENTNRQSQEDSYRGQERAGERHDMHDQEGYDQSRQGIENPVDTVIDRSFDNLKSGAHDMVSPQQQRRR